ncbi:ABC transporter permease [Actinomadura macrotermitis]|uniref:Glutathione transport system permease protein GsiD n=1 Tax=Actinomadura macrotermitis TaxID=2585200 RepID=A0A7K0BNH5_9ACTN|nr:ABC transporter permease [Actinomadura macrotermitis]MQY02687.1 Glutathione transport system permease protein GsiD [Actinomadura macrotermitis]
MRTTGTILAGLVVAMALLSLAWTPYDPTALDPAHTLLRPSGAHPLGTDDYGRDILSMILAGARTTLYAGVVAVVVAALAGVPLGVAAGMWRGWPSDVLMRGSDLLLAFPAVLLAILLAAAFGASTATAMTAVGIATVPLFARVARAATLQVMTREYILAARAAGRRAPGVAARHVLPNIASPLLIQASAAFAIAILAEASLSYLGLGAQPPTPSWGRMLHDAQPHLFTAPRLAVWPGLAIAVAVLGFNLLGDGVRDARDLT